MWKTSRCARVGLSVGRYENVQRGLGKLDRKEGMFWSDQCKTLLIATKPSIIFILVAIRWSYLNAISVNFFTLQSKHLLWYDLQLTQCSKFLQFRWIHIEHETSYEYVFIWSRSNIKLPSAVLPERTRWKLLFILRLIDGLCDKICIFTQLNAAFLQSTSPLLKHYAVYFSYFKNTSVLR